MIQVVEMQFTKKYCGNLKEYRDKLKKKKQKNIFQEELQNFFQINKLFMGFKYIMTKKMNML